jgi:hypothetical protein
VNHNYRPLTAAPTQRAIPIAQAVASSSTLGLLAGQVKESSDRLKMIQQLIPEAMRPALQAGPIDGDTWCLLVTGNAAAAKLRQLLPLILSKLTSKGVKVNSIRLKILIARKR